jgi:alcohol dehydrogenase
MNLMMLFQQQLRLSARSAAGWRTWPTPCRRWRAAWSIRSSTPRSISTDIGKALERMETRDVFGKIVLNVG